MSNLSPQWESSSICITGLPQYLKKKKKKSDNTTSHTEQKPKSSFPGFHKELLTHAVSAQNKQEALTRTCCISQWIRSEASSMSSL